ncbi:MAG TPA: pilus assembly PilX N-terminal domain-containing protein [Candidatus Elarobacter sp.]|nr:pilus assembly PilX N-terminal domain-containing protein [Candidatus Elarobacter sp.]
MSGKIREKGFALIGVLLFLVLLSAMAVTLAYTVRTEKRIGGSDQEGNLAYYDSEAGMEKMTADLGALYEKTKSPTAAMITNLGNDKPGLPDVGYTYVFNVTANPDGSPASRVQTISAGDFAGLSAQIIPINLDVTATRISGAQAHMTRDVEVAQIPVFQFGVFSDSDLSYFAGPNFDFGGRVHTNGDLYLAEGNGSTLTFHDKITAHGEIIRQTLVNGLTTSGNYTGTVEVPTAPKGCSSPSNSCSPLGLTQGSLVGGKGSSPTFGWDTFSQSTYFGNLVHQAAQLNLPFVADGAPIEIIREPLPGEDPAGNLGSSRLYTQAQIRVLMADTQADLPGGAEAGDLSLDVPNTCFASGCVGAANDTVDNHWKRPAGSTGDWSIIGGWLRVEMRKADGTYQNVTKEWLDLGFSRGLQTPDSEHLRPNTENPNAILILQQRREDPTKARGTLLTTGLAQYKWMPLNFYDTREGERRENAATGTTCSVGGILTSTEVDVGNLRKWLLGTIGTTGKNVEFVSQNGYILYYADHRGMLADPNPAATIQVKHGDFGYEDFINPSSVAGTSNGLLDPGEDVNGDGLLQTYGATNLGNAFAVPNGDPTASLDCSTVGRMNRVSGARHAIIVENGTLGNLPINFATGGGGFTVASEEPAYVLGNYNANDASPLPPASLGDPHASAAVIADTVTLLSKNWNNEQSMFNPRSAAGSATCPATASLASAAGNGTGRQACTTSYRVAIASGKSVPFAHPTGTGNDFGTDGGVHNFLRYLEEWGGQNSNYEGSLVSLYFAQYGVGAFKCCNMVYNPPGRNYAFDTDFVDPSKMPPGTPRFIDVVNVDMVQDLKPR